MFRKEREIDMFRETKKPSKADLEKKIEAWKTLNSVLVQTNNEFMKKITTILHGKEVEVESLKSKIEEGKGTEEDSANLLFLGGYVQALRDISGVK